jgi:UDP-N-acetyl-D-galactosamine dehydrogenase
MPGGGGKAGSASGDEERPCGGRARRGRRAGHRRSTRDRCRTTMTRPRGAVRVPGGAAGRVAGPGGRPPRARSSAPEALPSVRRPGDSWARNGAPRPEARPLLPRPVAQPSCAPPPGVPPLDLSDARIAVIGLGYVGLPLAAAFGRTRPVIGFDRNPARVAALAAGSDATGEVAADELAAAVHLAFSADPAALAAADVFIVAVPTPVDAAKRPDLSLLLAASESVGAALAARAGRPPAVVVYESTVFPGCTRGVCVPALERASGLVCDEGFFVGYSPERVNPGDPAHRLATIVKVTSGSTPQAAAAIDALYASVVTAGTHRAPSIEVAEAAKVIENTQRDLNIALMNELSIIFEKLGLDTLAVLEAAGTKWNFLPFRPGLVGGHCIGVDPYYLTFRAQGAGYHPEVILAGRRINDGMGRVVADRVVRLMLRARFPVAGSRVLVAGLTFKENCRDLRNSRAVDVIAELSGLGAEVEVWDPLADAAEAAAEYGLALVAEPAGRYDAAVVAVAHRAFAERGAAGFRALLSPGGILFDVKGIFAAGAADGRL